MYVDKFLLEQLQRSTKKLFLGLFAFSILFVFEYRDRHSHYVPDILLSFIIMFGLLIYLFTLNKNITIKPQVLSDVYNYKNNGFNLLRFVMSTLVFLSHATQVHFINNNLLNTLFPQDTGKFAVYCFFAISGFFMVQSLDNSKTNKEFLLKRVLRIFPLFLIVAVVIFICFQHDIKGLRGQIFLQAFSGQTWGASWTLKIEFLSYLILLLLYAISNRNKIWLLTS